MPEYTKAGVGYGVGQGAGRFAQALRDVLLAGQDRRARADELAFRQRESEADRRFREEQSDQTADYRQSQLDLEEQRIEEARASREAANRARAFERMDDLRMRGYNPVDLSQSSLPDQARLPGAGKYAQAMIEQLRGGPPLVAAGGYDPSRDVELQRSLELTRARGAEDRRTIAARESTPESPPTFSRHGMRFPYTPEGVEAAQEADARITGEADADQRRQLLVEGARQRMMNPETGEIELHRLRDVIAEMRTRPNTTLEDIEYIQDYFAR